VIPKTRTAEGIIDSPSFIEFPGIESVVPESKFYSLVVDVSKAVLKPHFQQLIKPAPFLGSKTWMTVIVLSIVGVNVQMSNIHVSHIKHLLQLHVSLQKLSQMGIPFQSVVHKFEFLSGAGLINVY
jgi:hypothetical protein